MKMNDIKPRGLSRRNFLKQGGRAALLALFGGSVLSRAAGRGLAAPAPPGALSAPGSPPGQLSTSVLRLAATDGYISLPGRAEPLYVFGFVRVPVAASINQVITDFKGNVQAPSPIIGVDENVNLYVVLTNLGLVVRPDLDDSHTIHWHGFRNPITVFDGVPEVSIAVPVARNFPYFFRPRDPGTYMYHCHFEDVEHVQMGMNGIVYVRPAQNFSGAQGGAVPKARLGGNLLDPQAPMGYVYNDGDGSTAYDREFTLMLNEIDTRPHDNLEAVQEFIWSDYRPNYWIMNGRAYPDTIRPSNDPGLPSQPISSLIQANPNETVLLRFANLGYEQHAMHLAGIRMKVVGEDATLLRGPGGADLTYSTNTIYIGPGEARDVLFDVPGYDPGGPGGSDGNGPYNTYLLKNRNYHTLTNNGQPGLGGMATEVRVYRDALPKQWAPNQTYS